MSQTPVEGINTIKAAEPGQSSRSAETLRDGEFVVEDTGRGDVEGIFRGDGIKSPQQVVSRFMGLNAGKDKLLGAFQGSEFASQFGAELALRSNANNRHLLLAGQSATRSIPNGEIFTVSQNELKQALAPFRGKLDQLRDAVANLRPNTGMTPAQSKTIGRTFTPALGLPVDPNV